MATPSATIAAIANISRALGNSPESTPPSSRAITMYPTGGLVGDGGGPGVLSILWWTRAIESSNDVSGWRRT